MILKIIINALQQIVRQPFRTLLVLQGVIWGTALGVFPPALIHGSFKKAEQDAERSGINRILVTLERRNKDDSYTWQDIETLRTNYAANFDALAGYSIFRAKFSGAMILATDTNALASRAMHIQKGRFFTAQEYRDGAHVCVLDQKLAEDWLGDVDPIGKTLRAGKIELEVIGVAAGGTADDLDEFGYQDGHVMSNFIKGLQRNMGAIRSGPVERLNESFSAMAPRTVFPDRLPAIFEIRAEPKDILNIRDRLRSDLIALGYQPVIFTNAILPFLYRQTLDTFVELNRAVFFLCVVTGTTVVCILMVLSVVERAREIAIRRVEGARQWHIALQFIIETGTICTVGGILGVPAGMGLAALRVWLEPLGAVTWAFPPVESVIMVSIVMVIGLIGGLLPAWRAMRLDPVEVLRYE
jgi:ABC-type antimicrobial peptide transport system permease subunit